LASLTHYPPHLWLRYLPAMLSQLPRRLRSHRLRYLPYPQRWYMDFDPLVLFANATAAAVQRVCLSLGHSHLYHQPRARQPHRRRPPPYLLPTVPLAALPTRWPVASAPDAEAYRASCATSAHSGYDAARLQQPMAACVDPRNYKGAWPHRHRSVMATLTCDSPPQLAGAHTRCTLESPESQ